MKTFVKAPLSCVLLFASSYTFADGTHGSRVCVKNNSNNKVKVHTFNGKDSTNCMGIPHKAYGISAGDSKWVKCHGQGKERCKISIHKFNFEHVCYGLPNEYSGAVWPNCQCNNVSKNSQMNLTRPSTEDPNTSALGQVEILEDATDC